MARRRRAKTKSALAAEAGISVRSLTEYEAGRTAPTDETVGLLARALVFPAEFFVREDPPSLAAETVSFRSLSKMTAGQRDCVLAAGELAIELDELISREFSRPEPDVPDLRGLAPTAAAEAVRAEWGLGVRPIRNLVHLLEAHGVRIYSLAHESREVDAFSFWRERTPYVFLNTAKTADRSRFDSAHELGHLVLHEHGGVEGRQAEEEADRFAAEFLMPKHHVLANAPRRPTLTSVVVAKKVWGVSAIALVHRLHELELITDWHYRTLCVQIRSQFRAEEPAEQPREASQVLHKVFAVLLTEGRSRSWIANSLNIRLSDLDELIFGLALTRVEGGDQHAISPSDADMAPPQLQLL
jgi:Zn-dependent peptidase ImmA (M78 family)/DNA-binding XRE family transcriptional regulator